MIVVIDKNGDKEKINNYYLLEINSIADILGLNIKSVINIKDTDTKELVDYVYDIIIQKTYSNIVT